MTPFGTTSDGCAVHALTLSAHGLTVTLLTYGAIVQDVRMDGIAHNLTVGSSDIADYEGAMCYHGGIVGPVANRISGAKAVIDGVEHQLERNFIGKHTLHGGKRGTQTRIWSVADHGADHATLTLDLPDGDCGLPGNRRITAAFAITQGPALTLSITTQTDAATLANLTNHSYWALDDTGHMNDHRLQILADAYLPTTDESLPTGGVQDVADTAFDFRTLRPLRLGQVPYDNTFVVAQDRRPLTPVLTLESGTIRLTVSTTEAGVHIYDDRPAHAALAIECQGWPDAPSHRHFPAITVGPDAPITQTTEWRFARV